MKTSCLAAALALCAPAVWAQQSTQGGGCWQALRQACSGMQPGTPQFRQCAQAQKAQLPACQASSGGPAPGAPSASGAPSSGGAPATNAPGSPAPSAAPGASASGSGPASGGGQGPAAGEGQGQCREEVEKVCAGIQPGEGRIRKCVKEHFKEFTPRCRHALRRRFGGRGPGAGAGGKQGGAAPNSGGNSGGGNAGGQAEAGGDD